MSASAISRRVLLTLGLFSVLGFGAWLRFAELADRPLHFDEATNARMLADGLEHLDYTFDPAHFHGPLLSLVADPIARLRGETSWKELTKRTLRLGVASCGLLAVAGALLLGSLERRGDGLAAAAFVATSPLLAYYSRMYIHEAVFTAFGMVSLLALLAFLHRPGLLLAGVLGVGVGLMASTRETFIISLFVWGIASLIWLVQTHPGESPRDLARHVREVKVPFLVFTVTLSLAIIAFHYSSFMRHPEGILDFFKSFFVYSPVAGHEKPAVYYLELLLLPKMRGGVLWTEGAVLLLALYGYFRCEAGGDRIACRFFVHGGALHLAVYSFIAYKTPWLACLGWLHMCLAAGLGAAQLLRAVRGGWRVAAAVAVAAILLWQGVQAQRAVFRFASDDRNPYAYVPTSTDVERMASWLEELAVAHPELNAEPVAVVGSCYWPLPWYLRGFERVGYWKGLPSDAADRPLLLALSEAAKLEESHVLFPRGLRHEVPVTVAIRKDLWERNQAAAP